MKAIKRLLQRKAFIVLLHWEYWPMHVVYAPIYFYWLWLCIRSRSFFFFNTSNPSIKNGGFLMESKMEIYNLMPAAYYPATLFFKAHAPYKEIIDAIERAKLNFPLIGKPNIGMRGMAVQKLENETDVLDYISNSKVDYLLQEYVAYTKEAGIFYYRFPGEMHGHISGIVDKEFLIVTGDGISTIYELLKKDKRHSLQIPALIKEYAAELNSILPLHHKKELVPYGNHCRGARFIDVSCLIDSQLEQLFDKVCKQVKGFYFGRLDVRYNSWEELKAGKFSIIEMNGAGSEPTHMYDPRHSIFFAWKEIIRHWNILFKISRQNHQLKKIPFMNFKDGMDMFSQNSRHIQKIQEEIKLTA